MDPIFINFWIDFGAILGGHFGTKNLTKSGTKQFQKWYQQKNLDMEVKSRSNVKMQEKMEVQIRGLS